MNLRKESKSLEKLGILRYNGINFDEWAEMGVRCEIARYEDMDAYLRREPYDVSRFGKEFVLSGLLTNIGGNFLCKLLRGDATPSGAAGSAAAPSMSSDGTTAGMNRFFNNANSRIGIGNNGDVQPPGGTAAAVGDMDLAGPTRTRLGMASTFPIVKNGTYTSATGSVVTVSDRQIVFRSVAGSADHNANWYEFTISNGGAGTGAIETTPGSTFTVLDHFVNDQGRKVTGQVWEPTITVTWS